MQKRATCMVMMMPTFHTFQSQPSKPREANKANDHVLLVFLRLLIRSACADGMYIPMITSTNRHHGGDDDGVARPLSQGLASRSQERSSNDVSKRSAVLMSHACAKRKCGLPYSTCTRATCGGHRRSGTGPMEKYRLADGRRRAKIYDIAHRRCPLLSGDGQDPPKSQFHVSCEASIIRVPLSNAKSDSNGCLRYFTCIRGYQTRTSSNQSF
mmetsp:Transcript_24341/g.67803  ORF Transcript_24341/g.67803 Transcript_24341/m.67803 type:complete len:212 (-) Transcript_24341:1342-1977(-)